MKLAPKRAASGARGASSTWPIRFRPTRSSAKTVSGSRRSAASGRGASIAAAAPGATTGAPPKRAAAEAAPGVSAIAAFAREALSHDAGEKIGEERCLAAEEMGGTGDIEHQPIGRIEGDERRVALGPVGDALRAAPASAAASSSTMSSAGIMARASASAWPSRRGRAARPSHRARRGGARSSSWRRRRAAPAGGARSATSVPSPAA